MPIKLHTVYSKALRNTDMETLGILCSSISIRASRLTLCFCIITKAYHHPCGVLGNLCLYPVQVRSSWSEMIQVHAWHRLQWQECKGMPSVGYGRGALGQKRGKESLEDEPGCAHKGRAGLLVSEHVPAWGEVVGVFTVQISPFL